MLSSGVRANFLLDGRFILPSYVSHTNGELNGEKMQARKTLRRWLNPEEAGEVNDLVTALAKHDAAAAEVRERLRRIFARARKRRERGNAR